MVYCRQAAFTVVFKHREVDNPQRCPFAFVGQTKVFTHFQAQCTDRVGDKFSCCRHRRKSYRHLARQYDPEWLR